MQFLWTSRPIPASWATFLRHFCWLNLLYSSLAIQLSITHALVLQIILALCVAFVFPERPKTLYASTWVVGNLCLGPPFFFLFRGFYNEPNYLMIFNSERNLDFLPSLVYGIVGLIVCDRVSAALGKQDADEAPSKSRAISRATLFCRALTLILMINFVPRIISIAPTIFQVLSTEPAANSYSFDGALQLKALHLYRQGHTFHESFQIALAQDARHISGNVHLPMPILFTLWSSFPSVSYIEGPYWGMVLLLMGGSYLLFERQKRPTAGLLCASLLGALYIYPACNYWILMTDAWAGPLVGGACLLYLAGHERSCAGLLALASVLRLVCLPLLCTGLLCSLWFRQSKGRIASWVLSLAGVFFIYFLHYRWSQQFGFFSQSDVGSRLNGTFEGALQAVRFGTVMWAGRDFTSYCLLFLCLRGIFQKECRAARFFAAETATMLVALTIFGLPGYSQFYGFNIHSMLVIGAIWSTKPRVESATAPIL